MDGIEAVSTGNIGGGLAQVVQTQSSDLPLRLAELRMIRDAEKAKKESDQLARIGDVLNPPTDYFIKDVVEVNKAHKELIELYSSFRKQGIDPTNPDNTDAFLQWNEKISQNAKLFKESQLARQVYSDATKTFDPNKHDAQHFNETIEPWLKAGVSDRMRMPSDFVIDRFDEFSIFDIIPEVPKNAKDAELMFKQAMFSPSGQGQSWYVRGQQKKLWNNIDEAKQFYMDSWNAIVPPPKEKSNKGNNNTLANQGNKNSPSAIFQLDYTDPVYETVTDGSGAQTTVKTNKRAQAKEPVSIFDFAQMPVMNVKDSSGKLIKFMPVSGEQGRTAGGSDGKTWLWGKHITDSKAEDALNEGDYPDVSIPLQGNEAAWKLALKGTELEDLQTWISQNKASVNVSAVDNQYEAETQKYMTTPQTDVVDMRHQEDVYRQVEGIKDVKVNGDQLTMYDDNGIEMQFSLSKDSVDLKKVLSGEKTATWLFLKSNQVGNMKIVTNPKDSKIPERK